MTRLKSLQNGGLTCSIFYTALGWASVVTGDRGIFRFFLPVRDRDEIIYSLNKGFGKIAVARNTFMEDMISKYFEGKLDSLPSVEIDLSMCTPFQIRVYKETMKIPYGEVRSYKYISKKILCLNGQRAVGAALAGNPIPLFIPCHRVISSNNGLGGFSAGSGIELKKKMLEIESSFTLKPDIS